MVINDQIQVYAQGLQVIFMGSFQTNGTSAPTIIRDGHSTLVTSVTRTGVGTFTVQLEQCPIAPLQVIAMASVGLASATPTKGLEAGIVDTTWNSSTRQFTIVTYAPGASASVLDPDTGARVNFMVIGSIIAQASDNA